MHPRRVSEMNRWLTMAQACEYARLNRKTVRQKILYGDFDGDRIGDSDKSHWRIDRESIDSWFERTRKKVLARLHGVRL